MNGYTEFVKYPICESKTRTQLQLYEMIFKRKSFHLFRNIGNEQISQSEIDIIYEVYKGLTPLCSDIKTGIRTICYRQY